ncbi:MAG: PEP-CTERM sorting domain-containing protein [Bryobacteraceae bacterium]
MGILNKYVVIAFLILIFTQTAAYADSVTVTLTGAGPVSNGAYYVLPYQISINGQAYAADCYDFFDDVTIGQSWQANELSLDQVADSGAFSGSTGHGAGTNALADYEEVAWLSSQATPTPQSRIDLQEAIWNVFDPGIFIVTTGIQQYLDHLAAAHGANYDGFSFSNFVFLEAITGSPGDRGFPQTFIIDTSRNANGIEPTAPEPGSVVLLAVGLGLVALSRGFRTRKPGRRSR